MIILLAIYIGFLVAIGVYSYRTFMRFFYYLESKEEVIILFLKRLWAKITYPFRSLRFLLKHKRFIDWKKNRLPELIRQTRKGDIWALAERIKESKHIGRHRTHFNEEDQEYGR